MKGLRKTQEVTYSNLYGIIGFLFSVILIIFNFFCKSPKVVFIFGFVNIFIMFIVMCVSQKIAQKKIYSGYSLDSSYAKKIEKSSILANWFSPILVTLTVYSSCFFEGQETTLESNEILDCCAVLISMISLFYTIISVKSQETHNKNSVLPLAHISISDYENDLAVKVFNYGTGPLIIDTLSVIYEGKPHSTVIELFKDTNILWTTFTEDVSGWTIPVGGEIVLIQKYAPTEKEKLLIRQILSHTTISITYKDIYNTKFTKDRELNFFGRHKNLFVNDSINV